MKLRTWVLTLACALAAWAPAAAAQTRQISGSVVTESGDPLAAARVAVTGTTLATLSDVAGRFTLTGVPAGAVRLTASRIGYETREVPVPAGQGTVTIQLQSASAPYEALGERIAAGLRWLRGMDPEIADGRHPIDGDDVFALVSRYDTGPSTEKRFETHVRHVDLQYLAAGHERILHAPAGALAVETPYDEAADVAFHAEPPFASSLLMRPGDLAVFFPGDAHKPGCMAGGRHAVRKVVVKVRI